MSPAEARALIDGRAKPLGSLGALEDLAIRLAVRQGTATPAVRAAVLVCAGDHGAAPRVSAFPAAVTAVMVSAFLSGRAAISILAAQTGARLIVADAGVAADLSPHDCLIDAKVAPGTRDWTSEPAMTPGQCRQAMAAGARAAADLAAEDITVLALGDMGIGNTASAALLVHKVAGLRLDVGRGAGLDDAGLRRKHGAVHQGAARTAGRLDPRTAMAEYGGFEIAMLAGAIVSAPAPLMLVIDGVIVTAAALVAHAIDPACLDHCVFAHRSAEPGHDAMLAHLGVTPLLSLGLRLGEGSGAALAIPLLRAAAGLFEMAGLHELVG